MKKTFLTIHVVLFTTVAIFSQNYIPYYQKTNSAEIYFCKHDLQNALQSYHEAFAMVEKPLVRDVYNATICAALSNQDSLMFRYMENSLIKGVPLKRFTQNTTVFEKYFDDHRWQKLAENENIYRNEYLSKVNKEYVTILDSLDKEDQIPRKKINFFVLTFKKLQISKKRINNNIRIVDSRNRIIIDSLINLYGYPNHDEVSSVNYCSNGLFRFISMWHITDSLFVDGIEYNAVLNGYISPEYYAQKKEYIARCKNTEPMYGTSFFHKTYKQKEKWDFFNKNREQIGMKTIEEEDIVRNFIRETKDKHQFCIYNVWFPK